MSSDTCSAISLRTRGDVPGCHDGSDTRSRFRLSCVTCRQEGTSERVRVSRAAFTLGLCPASICEFPLNLSAPWTQVGPASQAAPAASKPCALPSSILSSRWAPGKKGQG